MVKVYLPLFLFLLYPAVTNAQVGDAPVIAQGELSRPSTNITPTQEQSNSIALHGQQKAFRENKGQWGDGILYACQTNDNYVYLMRNRLVFGQMEVTPEVPFGMQDPKLMPHQRNNKFHMKGQAWNLDFVGANPKATVLAEKPSESYLNYIRYAESEKNPTNIRDYEKVVYKDLYPGVDLDYYVQDDHLKYDFRLQPQARISDIRLRYNGVDRLAVDQEGRLHIYTGGKDMMEDRPVSYQLVNGKRQSVNIVYHIIDKTTYGFKVIGNYNPNFPLVIDPMYLDWSTFFGTPTANNYTLINGVEVDSMGYVYIGGMTYYYAWMGGGGAPFPTTPGAYDTTGSGWYDGYITKFKQDGSTLIFSTLIGGSSYEYISDIDVDENQVVYATGLTYNYYDLFNWGLVPFPATNYFGAPNQLHPWTSPNPVDTDAVVSSDVFAVKFNAAGTALVAGAVLGGPEEDYSAAITAGRNGEIYITGTTASYQYPLSTGAFNTGSRGMSDIFISELTSNGTALLYSTRLGGNSPDPFAYRSDAPGQILVNSKGHIFVAGTVESPDFQFTTNAYSVLVKGMTDMFLTRINPTATASSQLMYSSAIGGMSEERGFGMILVNDDEAIIGGSTTSMGFPGAVNAKYGMSNYDGMLVRVNTSKTGINSLIAARYIGGSDEDFISDVKNE